MFHLTSLLIFFLTFTLQVDDAEALAIFTFDFCLDDIWQWNLSK